MNDIKKMLPDEYQCTGCGACKNICPCGAVEMSENFEGFLMPVIDEKKCVKCQKCVLTCPVLNPQYLNTDTPATYAVMANDDIRKISSSGGLFSVLANEVLGCGGYVCGVVYDEQFSPKHIVTNDPQEIAGMRGSKYMQSNTGNTYAKVGELLKAGKDILFTGMPCQVAGLNAFLGTRYDNLYTAELVCHGITPFKVFEKYRKDVLGGKTLKSLAFKEKEPWGWHAGINAVFEDDTFYQVPAEGDPYFRAYLSNVSKNLSCGTCKFNRLPRQADVTIGDFWRLSDFDKSLDDGKGTSLLLVNNEQGEKLFIRIEKKLQRCVQAPLTTAILGNGSISAPYKNHYRRNKFYRELSYLPFQKLAEHCLNNTFDVGVLGLWYGINYGSVLTYYALYCVLNQLGYDAIMVNKPDYLWSRKFDDPKSVANRFINKHCNVSGLHKYEEFPLLNDHCDAFILGSDVVWNYEIIGRSGGNFFFMDFVDHSKKKIAYAASFGSGYNAPAHIEYMNRQYAKAFDAVSVREDSGVALAKKHLGIDAAKVLDPVFLCDFSRFDELANQSTKTVDGEYIMTYILGGGDAQRELILSISNKLKCPRLINIANPNEPDNVQKSLKLDSEDEPDIEDWLNYMKHCHFFIGDSFHGLCFAIIFRRQFVITISNKMPSRDRFITLLNLCGLSDRLFYKEDNNRGMSKVLQSPIDYDAVFKRLEEHKQRSLGWLLASLKKEKSSIAPVPTVPPADCSAELFYLAQAVYNNYGGRRIVTWGEDKEFNAILEKYFYLRIPFWVARNTDLVNGDTVRSFSLLKDKSEEYYVVVPSVAHNPADEALFNEYGYMDIKDFIYRYHKPVIITADENGGVKREYFDAYGNRINGSTERNFHIVLRGFNNNITLGKNIWGGNPTVIEMQGFSKLSIGDGCRFTNTRISFFRCTDRPINVVTIRNNCHFDVGEIVIRDEFSVKIPAELLINENCTFGHHFDIRVNTGHKVVLGKECMFSFNIIVQAGDGHAIFDVKSGKRINLPGAYRRKRDMLTIGNHVWVGRSSILLSNTTIGSGSIIGAGSLAKGIFPNNCVAAGNPARVVKTDIAWSRNNSATDIGACGKENVALTVNATPSPRSGQTVLVLGGTHFMGIRLVEKLIADNYNVTIATRGHQKDGFGDKVTRIILDRTKEDTVRGALDSKYFDIIIDTSAYSSVAVQNTLKYVRCGRYVQVSSVAAYPKHQLNLTEELCDTVHEKFELAVAGNYCIDKKYAECAAFQSFPDISCAVVRIPFVVEPDNLDNKELNQRLFFYAEHVVKQIPMKVDNPDYCCAFVRTHEEADFLTYIANTTFEGAINFSSSGYITVGQIIKYIEAQSGMSAVYSDTGDMHPFTFASFIGNGLSLNLEKVAALGYNVSCLSDWIYTLLDSYIKMLKAE